MSWMTQRPENQARREQQGLRQKVVTKFIGNAINSVRQIRCHVFNPSARLSLNMELFFGQEFLTAGQAALVQASGYDSFLTAADQNATIIAMTEPLPAGVGNSYAIESGLLHTLISAQALPFAYEVQSGVSIYRIQWSLLAPTIDGADAPSSWFIRCKWEPNQPIDDDELIEMFSGCMIDDPIIYA